ncbi:MAG TPA: acetyl-CoA carboxylase biotin carboxyl carrier protein subunit [bacterium]|nr:acetyl-CoA carboxylase biotin carboxyl carrier protein subunit [bacterium]
MKKYDLKINGKDYKVEVKEFGAKSAKVEVNGKPFSVDISYPAGEVAPAIPRPVAPRAAAVAPVVQAAPAPAAVAGNSVNAPMPGLILKLLVKVGDKVAVGQKVAVMEAMKMENDINTTFAGTIAEIRVAEGANVKEHDPLIVIA